MKNLNQLRTLVEAFIFDNQHFIIENEMTPADFLINDCESTNWDFFFTDDELNKEITDQQIEEVKAFLKANYDYSL